MSKARWSVSKMWSLRLKRSEMEKSHRVNNRMRFLRYGRNDLTLVLVIVVGDIRRWENDQSLVVCKQNMVTSTNAEKSQRVKKDETSRLRSK